MHASPRYLSAARTFAAAAMVLLMLVSSTAVLTGPAGAITVEGVDGGTLPIEWTLGPDDSASFAVTLPPGGDVKLAELGLEGLGADALGHLNHSAEAWEGLSPPDIQGFHVDGDGLSVDHEPRGVWLAGDELSQYESAEGVRVAGMVDLNITSPDFSASGGGVWRHYIELEVFLNSGRAEFDVATYVLIDIPKGHCMDTDEIRLADLGLREVPYQLAEVETSSDGASVVRVGLMFAGDFRPAGPSLYRVYYGNPRALEPKYPPILLNAELWDYRDLSDPAFTAKWESLRWTGTIGAGTHTASIYNPSGDGGAFIQTVTANPARTYSQVWTATDVKYDDFLLQTWISQPKLAGPQRSAGLWGLDFRVSGTDCYRLVYMEALNDNVPNRMALYRVSNERHMVNLQAPNDYWTLLDSADTTFNSTDGIGIRIRAKGADIRVWANDDHQPLLSARDANYQSGLFGTFLAANGVAFSGAPTDVSCAYNVMFIYSPDVNISRNSPSWLPSEERSQHHVAGSYVSDPVSLEGARDAVLSLDVSLPWDTKYTANILAEDGTLLMGNVRDGDQVPEAILDDALRLELVLETGHDHITPALRGWGVGYSYVMNLESDRGPEEVSGLVLSDGAVTLAPSREVWIKQDDPVMKPDNIGEDQGGVTVGSIVSYGDVYRLYYTGVGRSGSTTICMAETYDGMEFFNHRVVVPAAAASMGWDAKRLLPVVLRANDLWYMFYIGVNGFGQVGLAVSSNGVDWGLHPDPVLSPSSGGGFDGFSIEDCTVTYDEAFHRFHMYYTGRSSGASNRLAIGYATSTDGAGWSKSTSNPVLIPGGTGSNWDTAYVRMPYLVQTRDQLVVYYLGGTGNNPYNDRTAIGVAFTDNGVDFKKSGANPVLVPGKNGITDDVNGVTSVLVVEDETSEHYMLYSARNTLRVENAYVARSGYVKSGHLTTFPYVLDRAPRVLGPLLADLQVPPSTMVTLYVRSYGTGANQVWTEVLPGELPQTVPGEKVQLRVNMTSDYGDAAPSLKRLALDYRSNVRHSEVTVYPAITMPEDITTVYMEWDGENLAGHEFLVAMASDEVVIYTGHGRYGSGPDFGYRAQVNATPGLDSSLRWVNASLGYLSFPADVEVDAGGEADPWRMYGKFTGSRTVDVTEALAYAYGMAQDEGEEEPSDVTLTIRVSTGNLGRIRLDSVHIVVDTPPRVTSASPAAFEVYMDEGSARTFSITVSELDGQPYTLEWWVDGNLVPGEEGLEFVYVPDTEPVWTSTPVDLTVTVTDGNLSDGWYWVVYVNELGPGENAAPLIDSYSPIDALPTMDENTTLGFSISASDPDQRPWSSLELRWFLDETLEASGQGTSYDFVADYRSAGLYTIRVEAFDGELGVNHTWTLTVNDVEPPPNGNGNGDDGDGDGISSMLLLLIIIIIVAVAASAGAMAMKARSARMGGEAAPPEPGLEPVLADVPLEPELAGFEAPPATEGAVAKEVAAGPGTGGAEAADVARGAAAAGLGAAPIVGLPLADKEKDRTFVVEEVYVVYNDGRLMCHQTRAERTSVDTDLFGGMFTAIQQFIHDSMGGADGGTQVGRLDYGENRILVERGNHVFLAAIIYGEEHEVLREALRDVINRIEGAYAGVIERWSGDQTQVAGVADFVAPLIGMTADLTRETIMSRTRTVGVKMLSEVEFFQGFVRLKVALRNDTKTVITNVATDIVFDSNVLRMARVQPEQYEVSGTKVKLGTINPREKKTVAYYLDPLICQESDIDGTATFKDAEGAFKTVTMKRRRADIVCPIFFTEENANTAMLKRLIHEELKESDSKLFTIPKMLPASDAFLISKEVIRGHDVRFVREFVESGEDGAYHGEAWFYGVTKVKKDRMVIRTSIWEDRKTVEFFVASGRIESITGLLAELGQNLNKTLKEKYLGRVSLTPVMDPESQDEVKGLGLLIDKYSEGEMEAGEVDQG